MRALLLILLLVPAPARAVDWWFGARADSRWSLKPVTLDADEGDWDARIFDDTNGVTYAFQNDADYLYILYIPHTKTAKFQLSGGYRQTFTVWIHPAAKIRKTLGFFTVSPGNGEAVAMQPVGGAAKPSAAGPALAALPAPDRRAVMEARVPLSAAGVSPGQIIAVGLEASAPDHWPAKPPVRQGQEPDRDEAFSLLRVWVRVRLAKPPR